MKRLTTLLMTLLLMSAALWAEETVTVSANSSDISEGLDLKVVAKLFAEAKNLEEFENALNNPDSAFCNLDLNGDGQVDYLRVVETGEGNKRLIVLQAILAKDIYQDVASIYVEKDEKNEVSVQVIGDEYVYGKNYIIEPVYVYRPVIYDWFWSDMWYAWHSPWYWGYWPGWWYAHSCWAHDWYWRHCYAWHHHHHWCSFRPGRVIHTGYHELHPGVSRREYATAHPDRSFAQRNNGLTNAREIRTSSGVQARGVAGSAERRVDASSRTYGSRNTATSRTQEARTSNVTRGSESRTVTSSRGGESRTVTATRGTESRTTAPTATRSVETRTVTTSRTPDARSVDSRSASTTRSVSTTRSTNATSRSAGSFSGNSYNRSSSSYSGGASRSSSSYSGGASRSSSSYSGGASRSSSSYSGGASSRGGGGFSGGASSRGGGGGGSPRR